MRTTHRWIRSWVFSFITVFIILSLASPALAATLPFSGSLGATQYNRVDYDCASPVPAANPNFYDAYTFTVDASGSYTLETTSANLNGQFPTDTSLFLYSPSFNPGAPASNCIGVNDDIDTTNSNFLSRLTINLTANTTYIMVITSFEPSVTGAYSGQIAGPGNITLVTAGALPFGGDVFDPGDDRINRAAKDRAAPVAIYCRDEGITVLLIDPVTAQGTTAIIQVSREIIDVIGVPQGGHVPLAGRSGYSLWRLADGRFQVNAFYANQPDKPYVFVWQDCDPFTAVHLAN